MPTVNFSATFTNHREVDIDLTEEEWVDLQSGKKKYWDFLDDGDYDNGEWVSAFVQNTETGDVLP